MTSHPTSDPSAGNSHSRFATTRWSIIAAAAADDSAATDALEQLCESYWYPLYAFIRRQGYAADDAQDLTQGFFTRLIEKRDLSQIDPQRGRFRAFLIAAAKHFLMNEHDRRNALKRGGGWVRTSVEFAAAEDRLATYLASHEKSPDEFFERQWALTMIERTVDKLRSDYADRGQSEQFEHLQPFLTDDPGSIREAAAAAEITEAAFRVALHRLRKRFGSALRDEIRQTVTTDEEVDDELRSLFTALAR
ncbi:MAG: ECF-type sigma factor [Pirellulaceae bacterium]|jgi:RNA polymerase sigma-70 factor (ECF subfamily)|nr:ECF-type sigma factor [Pirellulaceae bacterium]MDP7018719.1 ECF-type sigma factor [Pirellulaceae bacterium]